MGPPPLDLGPRVGFSTKKTRLAIERLVLTTKDAKIELTGALDDVTAPHGAIAVKATGSLREIGGGDRNPPRPQRGVAVDRHLPPPSWNPFDPTLPRHRTSQPLC